MSFVRTYNPSVRVGNWFEDKQLEEDALKEFLDKRESGELLIQKIGNLTEKSNDQSCSSLTVSTDGKLKFGDRIQLVNDGTDERLVEMGKAKRRNASVLSIGVIGSDVSSDSSAQSPSLCTSSLSMMSPSPRNILIVKSCDGTPDGQSINFGQPFQLVSLSGTFLSSDRATFGNATKKSRHQAVNFTNDGSFLTHWKAEYFNPQLRLEFEFSPIPVNEKLIIKHVKTNQSLAVEDYITAGLFGPEFEVSTNTFFDDHRAEKDANHWSFHTTVPAGADV